MNTGTQDHDPKNENSTRFRLCLECCSNRVFHNRGYQICEDCKNKPAKEFQGSFAHFPRWKAPEPESDKKLSAPTPNYPPIDLRFITAREHIYFCRFRGKDGKIYRSNFNLVNFPRDVRQNLLREIEIRLQKLIQLDLDKKSAVKTLKEKLGIPHMKNEHASFQWIFRTAEIREAVINRIRRAQNVS